MCVALVVLYTATSEPLQVADAEEDSWAERTLAGMALEQKVGHVVFVGVPAITCRKVTAN
jgi:hypothetical protein